MKLQVFSKIRDLPQNWRTKWNQLIEQNYPFISFEYLHALEASKSICEDAGWKPQHLVFSENGHLVGAVPMYLKKHSYGEYIFDWQWADAFARQGLNYYPKIVAALPFTPVTGPRILYKTRQHLPLILTVLKQHLQALAKTQMPLKSSVLLAPETQDKHLFEQAISSCHFLFTDSATNQAMAQNTNWLKRETVQFHWNNQQPKPFDTFADFLVGFRSSKRKQIKRERRKIVEQGVVVTQKKGADISPDNWQDFFNCYQDTYLKHSGHGGYLTKAFFEDIAQNLQQQCLMVLASKDDKTVASALFFFDDTRLYGRYWGATEKIDCLHFELCYYQGIDFAIAEKLQVFDPGTQGEHKLVRGFNPTMTHSWHWIAHEQFAEAIKSYLQQEQTHTQQYQDQAEKFLPFHRAVE